MSCKPTATQSERMLHESNSMNIEIVCSPFHCLYFTAATMEDSLSEVGPAVIFVAVSGAVFLCLIGLLFLPISSKVSRAQKTQTGS